MKYQSATQPKQDTAPTREAQLDIVTARIHSTRRRLKQLSGMRSEQSSITRCRLQLETDERLLAALKSVRR